MKGFSINTLYSMIANKTINTVERVLYKWKIKGVRIITNILAMIQCNIFFWLPVSLITIILTITFTVQSIKNGDMSVSVFILIGLVIMAFIAGFF